MDTSNHTGQKSHPSDKEKEKAWNRGKDWFERGCKELKKGSKVLKLKLNATKMQQDRRLLFRRLGEETYRLLKEGRFDASEVERLVARIDDLNQDIDAHRTAISETTQKPDGSAPKKPENPNE